VRLDRLPQGIRDIARWSPGYGLNQLVHAPLLGGAVDWTWIVNAIAWLAIFAGARSGDSAETPRG
jgi:ABC-2 type transport system permease protein